MVQLTTDNISCFLEHVGYFISTDVPESDWGSLCEPLHFKTQCFTRLADLGHRVFQCERTRDQFCWAHPGSTPPCMMHRIPRCLREERERHWSTASPSALSKDPIVPSRLRRASELKAVMKLAAWAEVVGVGPLPKTTRRSASWTQSISVRLPANWQSRAAT